MWSRELVKQGFDKLNREWKVMHGDAVLKKVSMINQPNPLCALAKTWSDFFKTQSSAKLIDGNYASYYERVNTHLQTYHTSVGLACFEQPLLVNNLEWKNKIYRNAYRLILDICERARTSNIDQYFKVYWPPNEFGVDNSPDRVSFDWNKFNLWLDETLSDIPLSSTLCRIIGSLKLDMDMRNLEGKHLNDLSFNSMCKRDKVERVNSSTTTGSPIDNFVYRWMALTIEVHNLFDLLPDFNIIPQVGDKFIANDDLEELRW